MSAPMVRAILAGTKTQTRRVCDMAKIEAFNRKAYGPDFDAHRWSAETNPHVLCPYGDPVSNDRLWVRETWAPTTTADGRYAAIAFKAGGPLSCVGDAWAPAAKWKPGIHLRRVNARITLDVLSVRVERLQDITEADARAEGVRLDVGCPCQGDADEPGEHLPLCRLAFEPWPGDSPFGEAEPYRRGFAALWCSINGRRSWDENPWVWRIEFRRVAGGGEP